MSPVVASTRADAGRRIVIDDGVLVGAGAGPRREQQRAIGEELRPAVADLAARLVQLRRFNGSAASGSDFPQRRDVVRRVVDRPIRGPHAAPRLGGNRDDVLNRTARDGEFL